MTIKAITFPNTERVYFKSFPTNANALRLQKDECYCAEKGLFFVNLKKKQFLGEKGDVKTEYAVQKVSDHKSAACQITLPLEQI